jgi:hypothetical protein
MRNLVSKFAFKMQLVPLHRGGSNINQIRSGSGAKVKLHDSAGLHTLTPPDP